MTAVILQPSYLPWLGFFEQMYRSDIFVIYDDVQYDKGGWRNRNRIKTAHGPLWLTVPVHIKMGMLIKDVRINNHINWAKKHLKSIYNWYHKANFFEEYFPYFEAILSKKWEFLVDLDLELISLINKLLGIKRKIILSSSLKVQGDRIQRLLKILKLIGADIFYEGASGKNYIREEDFEKEGIKVIFQDYQHPVYPQLYDKFVPYLSVIDLLFNCGGESLYIILNKLEFKNKNIKLEE
jgi:hypothetical protein